jgi:hypothetical protein
LQSTLRTYRQDLKHLSALVLAMGLSENRVRITQLIHHHSIMKDITTSPVQRSTVGIQDVFHRPWGSQAIIPWPFPLGFTENKESQNPMANPHLPL